MVNKCLPPPGMERGELVLHHVTSRGPMEGFLPCERRGGVQLPEGVMKRPPLWGSLRLAWAPRNLRALDIAALEAGGWTL